MRHSGAPGEKPDIQIPDFDAPSGDALLEESIAPSQELVGFYNPDVLVPSEKYDTFVAEGLEAMDRAFKLKQERGPEAAAKYFDWARINLLQAVWEQPEHKDDKLAIGPTDPRILVNYAVALDELVESGRVPALDEDKDPTAKWRDHTEEWKQISSETLKQVLSTLAKMPSPATQEDIALAEIAEERLAKHDYSAAKEGLRRVKRNFAKHDSDPNLIESLDEFSSLGKFEQREHARVALQGLLASHR